MGNESGETMPRESATQTVERFFFSDLKTLDHNESQRERVTQGARADTRTAASPNTKAHGCRLDLPYRNVGGGAM